VVEIIVVYGGSFDPINKNHLYIIDTLIKKYAPHYFVIIPTGNEYRHKPFLSSFEIRKKLIEKALLDYNAGVLYEGIFLEKNNTNTRIVISELENDNKRVNKGTKSTLDLIREKYNDVDIFFVMGADNFNKIETWINFETFLLEYNLIIIKRPSQTLKLDDLDLKFKRIDIIDLNLLGSSTDIRIDFLKNKELLTKRVYDEIFRLNLYGGDYNE